MQPAGELTGPKVHVERAGGTADSGAGQLVALGDDLLIRAARHTRSLGVLTGLVAIELQDHKGSAARLRYVDGSTWTLTETRDGSLLPFLQELAERCRRPELIADAPSVSMRVREAIGPERKPALIVVALGLLAIAPVAALCSLLPWLGYALIVAVVAWLATLMLVERDQLELPARVAKAQWPVKLALPIMLSLAAALGLLHGRQGALAEGAAARAAALDQQRRAETSARRRREDVARTLEIERAVADLRAALDDGEPTAIERQATRLRALAPRHAALAQLRAAATPPPRAPANEEERSAAFAAGLRKARAVTADHVRCDSAREIGDAWAGLRLARPDDPQLREAQKLTSRLERCRAGVRRALIDNATRASGATAASGAGDRHGPRELSAAEVDAAVRAMLAGFGLAEPLALP